MPIKKFNKDFLMNCFNRITLSLLSSLSLLALRLHAEEENRKPTESVSLEQKISFKEHLAQTEEQKPDTEEIQSKGASFHSTLHLGQYHRLRSVAYDGKTIELEDGSIWQVCRSHYEEPLNWYASDTLVVKYAPWYRLYDYEICNTTTHKSIYANLKTTPILFGSSSYWVGMFCREDKNLQIALNDGSLWVIYGPDEKMIRSWHENDHIIIGTNDGYFTKSSYPYILINASLNTSLRAACRN
jgi:hypothetical protein